MNDTTENHGIVSRRQFLAAAVGGSASYVGVRATGLDPVAVSGATRWRAGIDAAGQVETVGEQAVYATDGQGSLVALGLDSGVEQWRFDTGDDIRQVEADGDAVYARTESGVDAVTTDDGASLWSVAPDGHPRTLAVEDEGVFVGTDTGTVRRVSRTDGAVTWQSSVAGAPWETAGTDTDAIFVGSNAGTVAALELDTGERRWRFQVPGDGGYYDDSPRLAPVAVDAASRNLLVWSDDDRTLRALSTRDGSEQWRVQPETGGLHFRGDVVSGSVYVPDGRVVRALDPGDGSEQLRAEVDGELAQLRVGKDGLVAAGVGSVYGISTSSGAVRWRYDTGRDQALLLAEAAGGRIVASEVHGRLHALADDGTLRWEHDLDAPLHGTPLVAGETVVAGTRAGTIYAVTDPPASASTFARRALDTNQGFSLAAGLVGGGLFAAGFRWLRE